MKPSPTKPMTVDDLRLRLDGIPGDMKVLLTIDMSDSHRSGCLHAVKIELNEKKLFGVPPYVVLRSSEP